jgi:hypothetical protein
MIAYCGSAFRDSTASRMLLMVPTSSPSTPGKLLRHLRRSSPPAPRPTDERRPSPGGWAAMGEGTGMRPLLGSLCTANGSSKSSIPQYQ